MSKKTDANPILQDVIRLAVDSRIAGVHTSLPGRIEEYDHETQKARVQPLIKKKYLDGRVESLPAVDHVPVIWPRTTGVGGACVSFTFPVRKGDLCLLFFTERALENWLTLGGEQEPGDSRKYDLTDAVALMGLSPFSLKSKAENNDDVLLTYSGDGHERRIQISPDKLRVRFDDSTLDLTHTGDFRVRLAYDGESIERKLEIRPEKTILKHGNDLVLKFEPDGTEKIDLNYGGDKQLKVTEDKTTLCHSSNVTLEMEPDGTKKVRLGNLTDRELLILGDSLKLRFGTDTDLFMDLDEAVLRVGTTFVKIDGEGDVLIKTARDLKAQVDGDITAEAANIKLTATEECRLEGATVRIKTSDFDMGPGV